MRFVLLALLLLMPALADSAAERQKKYPDLSLLVERAQSVPPEFAAATLLRVAASPNIIEIAWKKELVAEAFRLAGMARFPIDKGEWNARPVTFLAFGQRLDRLSLESAAVRQMMLHDKAKAWELFDSIRMPKITRASCEDAVIDNPAAYFSVLGLVSKLRFGDDLRSRNEQLEWLNHRVSAVQSTVELPLILHALLESRLTPVQWKVLVGSLASAIDRISGGDRAFASTLQIVDVAFEQLASTIKQAGINADSLISSYRSFLVRHFTAVRCAVNKNVEEQEASIVKKFNLNYVNPTNPSITAIIGNDTKASSNGSGLKAKPVNADGQLEQQFYRLMFGGSSRGLSDGDKNTETWREEFQIYLKNILDAKPQGDESDEAFFLKQVERLTSAAVVVPTGPERDKVIAGFLSYLKNNNLQQSDFLLWFYQFEQLAILTNSIRPADQQKFLAAVEQTGHPVMSLYAMRERILPQTLGIE